MNIANIKPKRIWLFVFITLTLSVLLILGFLFEDYKNIFHNIITIIVGGGILNLFILLVKAHFNNKDKDVKSKDESDVGNS